MVRKHTMPPKVKQGTFSSEKRLGGQPARSWIYGVQPILEALRSGERSIEKVWIAYGRSGPGVEKLLVLAKKRRIPVSHADRASLENRAGTSKHQGIIALVSQVIKRDFDTFLDNLPEDGMRFLALLDGIQDPGNLGAIIRTACAVGLEGLLLPAHRVCPVTPSVMKASAGASEWMPLVQTGNASEALRRLRERGTLLLGADSNGDKRIYEVDLKQDLCLVLGGEGKGLRPGLAKVCDEIVSVPMMGPISSLNVSVASAVLFYEVVRQRGWRGSSRRSGRGF